MRIPTRARALKAIVRSMPALAVLLALGCSTGARRAATAGPTTQNALAETPVVDIAPDAGGGFKITQQVSVTDEVRADYEAAAHLLHEVLQLEPDHRKAIRLDLLLLEIFHLGDVRGHLNDERDGSVRAN